MYVCVFSGVSGPQWTTDGNNDLENGTSNDTNGKGGKKGNNNTNTNRDEYKDYEDLFFRDGGQEGGVQRTATVYRAALCCAAAVTVVSARLRFVRGTHNIV